MIMLDLSGLTLTEEERELLQHPQTQGVILFARNYESPEQLRDLVFNIRQSARDKYLLISVDQEGGRVQRFQQGFTRLPSLGTLGRHYKKNAKEAEEFSELLGWLMAIELLQFDLDFSFAPVLDLNKKNSEIIGDRAFDISPEIVTLLSKHYIDGMKNAGMSSVGKHFPGHGTVSEDSHLTLPVDTRNLEKILQEDLIPFLKNANVVTGIMPAHVMYPEVDQNPPCFSVFWLKNILRERCLFDGPIFSDDLTMKGAALMGDVMERARAATAAGCDMILVCNDREGAIQVLEDFERRGQKKNPDTQKRLEKMRHRAIKLNSPLIHDPKWQRAQAAIRILNKE